MQFVGVSTNPSKLLNTIRTWVVSLNSGASDKVFAFETVANDRVQSSLRRMLPEKKIVPCHLRARQQCENFPLPSPIETLIDKTS